jgi:hypothetical protein
MFHARVDTSSADIRRRRFALPLSAPDSVELLREDRRR